MITDEKGVLGAAELERRIRAIISGCELPLIMAVTRAQHEHDVGVVKGLLQVVARKELTQTSKAYKEAIQDVLAGLKAEGDAPR